MLDANLMHHIETIYHDDYVQWCRRSMDLAALPECTERSIHAA
jgi:hypothetical protein